MPLSGDPNGRARLTCRVRDHRSQFGKISWHKVVVPAVGRWPMDEISTPILPNRRRGCRNTQIQIIWHGSSPLGAG